MGNFMREYWIPAALSSELTANGAADAAHVVGRAADRISRSAPAGSACSTIAARTAAPRCSSAATRRKGCAAPITAGSSTSTATASTCRTCPSTRRFPTRSPPRPIRSRERNGLIWTYMGARKEPPPLPMFEAVMIADDSERNHVHGAARVQLSAGARRRHRHLASRLPAHGRGRRRGYSSPAISGAMRSPTARPSIT